MDVKEKCDLSLKKTEEIRVFLDDYLKELKSLQETIVTRVRVDQLEMILYWMRDTANKCRAIHKLLREIRKEINEKAMGKRSKG